MINSFFIIFSIIIHSLCIVTYQQSIYAGGAGYNLAFYNLNDVAIFKIEEFNIIEFSIEFWMKEKSFSPKSTPFSLLTYNNISFSWTIHDKIQCYGQTFNAYYEFNNIYDWNHIVFQAYYDINEYEANCKIYMNGTEIHNISFELLSLEEVNDKVYLSIGQYQKEYGKPGWIEHSFQGYIDDFVLWKKIFDEDTILNHISNGIDTSNINIISLYRFNEISSNNVIIDSISGNNGKYGYVKNETFIKDDDNIKVSYGYSDAPIITPNVPSYISVTDRKVKINLNYFNESEVIVTLIKFPKYGNIFDDDENLIEYPNDDISSYSYIYYEPFIPLESSLDHIEFMVNEKNEIRTFDVDEYDQRIGQIELTLFENGNDNDKPPIPLNKSINVYPLSTTMIPLECKCFYGEKTYPVIKTIPLKGVLYQVVDNISSSDIITYDPIYLNNTKVSSKRGIIAYIAPKNSSEEDWISYTCESGYLRSSDEIGNISISLSSPQISKTLLGTIRYGLYFDGFLNFAYSNISNHRLQSASLYIQIDNHPLLNKSIIPVFSGVYFDDEKREILCELFLYMKSEEKNHYGIGFMSRYITTSSYVNSTTNEHNIEINKWSYIGITFTASNSLSLMINGYQVGQGTVHPNYGFKEIFIGKGLDGKSYFRGTITNIQLWKTSFESSILHQYSLGQLTGNETGLLSFWSFDEGDGDKSYDKSPNKLNLSLNEQLALRPKWRIIEGIDFNIIRLLINETIVIPLLSYDSFGNNLNSSYIITSLPDKGSLYQYNPESKNNMGERLEKYNPNESFRPISFWVDSIVSYSSSRNHDSSLNDHYNVSNIIGSPKFYVDKISSPLLHHGDHTYSWSPLIDCGKRRYEYIEFLIQRPVYVVDMEIYENLNPGSVQKILSYDSKNDEWVTIYERDEIIQNPPYYNVFKPPICNIYPFKSNRFKIIFDVCSYPGNKGIEAIRVYGTDSLDPSIVTDEMNRIIYVPNMNIVNTNDDSFSYSTLECRLSSSFNINSFSYTIKTYTTGFGPISLPSQSSTEENQDVILVLNSYKTNPTDNSTLQHLITELPLKGMLYEIDYPYEEIVHLVKNKEGKVLFRPDKNTCGLNYTSFSFAASDSKTLSSPSEFLINVICLPNFHIVPTAAFYLVFALLTLQILFSISALLYYLYSRFIRGERSRNHPIFIITQVVLSFLGYFYPYLILMKPSNPLCYAKIWLIHIGLTASISSLFVHVYCEWKSFTIKALRSDKKVSYNAHHIILFTIITIECIQLLVFSVVNRPESSIVPYGENTALRISKCIMKHYSEYFLYLLKGLVLMISLVICIVLFSWTPYNSLQMRMLTIIIIIIQCVGILGLVLKAFTSNFNITFITEFLTISIIISLSLLATFFFNIKHFTKKTESDENEMGSINMTQKMNNHSDNKSVLELIETLESKEKELVKMKKKLLKKESKIRQLEQKILSYD